MYEQSDFSPMEKSIFQKYDSNILFSEFRQNYAYNSPSALYANSPLGMGTTFSAHSQQYAPQSSFASVALNALSSLPGNTTQSAFGMNNSSNNNNNLNCTTNNNIMSENTPNRSEHTSLEETQNNLEEQNSAEEEHIAALQAQHNVQSSSTIPNYPNYNGTNNNINTAINSNNAITGSNNININGSNTMSFATQPNFILKKNLNEPHMQLSNIPSTASPATAPGSFIPNNQQFRYQYPTLDENLISAHPNYPTQYYDSIASNNDNLNYGYNQHTTSPNYNYQPAPIQLSLQQNNPHSTPSSYQQNYQFSASSTLKKNGLPANFFYESPRNYGSSFLPYTPPIVQQGAQSGFTQFIQNQSLSAEIGAKQSQQPQFYGGDQEDCQSFNFLSTPVHQIEQQNQQQNQQQQQQQQPQPQQQQQQIQQQQQQQPQQQQQQNTIMQPSQAQIQQSQKANLNLLQQKKQLEQQQRYNQEKAQLQQQQMQFTEQALLEQQQQKQQPQLLTQQQQHQQSIHQQQNPSYSNYPQYSHLQQQQQQFSNFIIPGQKIVPLQPTPITLAQKNINTVPIVSEANKISYQPKTLNEKNSMILQNFQQNQESVANQDDEENVRDNEQSIDEENQNDEGEEDEEDQQSDDEEINRGSKKGTKNMTGSNKVKKTISKNSYRNKAAPSISAPSSSDLQNFALGSTKGMTRKQINETKNIPKNYSKAIIGYIQKHPEDCARLLGPEYSFDEFDKFLMDKKEKLTAIKDLRSLWTTQVDDKLSLTFNRVFRILSFKFFRENAVSYIYSSRKIKNTRALITYRFILQRALHDPESFSFMKFQN